MSALLVLIPISFALALGGLIAFLWAAKSGQFSDLTKPAERLAAEDRLSKSEPRQQ